jgi:hypothetical protein
MANLFAFRATEPEHMKRCNAPIGKRNNYWLKKLATEAGLIVAAWGNDGAFQKRSIEVKSILRDMSYLALNKSGEPAHPLYQKADKLPKKWLPIIL